MSKQISSKFLNKAKNSSGKDLLNANIVESRGCGVMDLYSLFLMVLDRVYI